MPWPTSTAFAAQAFGGRAHIADVGREVERLVVGRVRPVVAAQVHGMSLPAALREVLLVAMPDPGARQLTVDEEERLAAGPSFRQPRLDVDAAIEQVDLVLAHGPGAGRPLDRPPDHVDGGFEIAVHVAHHSPGAKSRPVAGLGLK